MPRRGRRLGVDVGAVRIGVAISDPDAVLATPLATVPRDASGRRADIARLVELVEEHAVVEVIVGLPVTLAGVEGLAAREAREYARRLEQALRARSADPVPVRFTDERMSTVAAVRRLSERGVRGRRQRAVVDQAAAVEILQGWLDAQRRPT